MFDKLSDITLKDWLNMKARYILNDMPTDELFWIWSDDMSDKDKKNNSGNDTQDNPMKAVKTISLPTKHEFSSDNSHNSSERKQAKFDMQYRILSDEAENIGVIYKKIEVKNRQEWWDNLSEEDKNEVLSIPNFDPRIFEEITGIKV